MMGDLTNNGRQRTKNIEHENLNTEHGKQPFRRLAAKFRQRRPEPLSRPHEVRPAGVALTRRRRRYDRAFRKSDP
jgi:hypothetical protein